MTPRRKFWRIVATMLVAFFVCFLTGQWVAAFALVAVLLAFVMVYALCSIIFAIWDTITDRPRVRSKVVYYQVPDPDRPDLRRLK